MDSCSWQYFKQAYTDLFVYSDSRKITKCTYNEAATSDSGTPLYAFDINGMGDALIFEQNHIGNCPRSKGLRINMCNGGTVNANIIN